MAIENMVRKLPFSLEAEQSLLGSILIDPEALNEITGLIEIDDFYLKEHREIYSAMQKLFRQSRKIDPVTLMDALVQEKVYNAEESKSYIRTLAEVVPYASNVKDYARIVRDKSLLRQLIHTTEKISEEAYAELENATDIISVAESRIYEITKAKEQQDFTHIKDVLVSAFKTIKETADNPEEKRGLQTGFPGVDDKLIGMGKGQLIIVGARPGMGKTSFAMNVAVNVAKQTNKAICVFTLEMDKEELVTRMLSSEAMVASNKLKKGLLSESDWKSIAEASSILAETQIYIDDTSNISVSHIKSKLRRVKDPGLVIIDYLGIMEPEKSSTKSENRVQEIGNMTRGLKLLAKEMKVPVICCAQLNRGTDGSKKEIRAPQLSDLRESGSIEQDADVVIFLHRDYYGEDPEKKNKAEIIIAKNRHGEMGKVEVGFHGEYTRFRPLDTRHENG